MTLRNATPQQIARSDEVSCATGSDKRNPQITLYGPGPSYEPRTHMAPDDAAMWLGTARGLPGLSSPHGRPQRMIPGKDPNHEIDQCCIRHLIVGGNSYQRSFGPTCILIYYYMLSFLSTGSSRKCIFKIWEGLGPSQFLKYSFLEPPMLKILNMIPDYYIIILLC